MSVVIDGTSGLTTPGVVNTAGETIATTLSVTGATNLAVSSGNVGIGTASPAYKLDASGTIRANGGYFRSTITYTVETGADILGTTGGMTSIGANPLVFGTDGTEQARITAAGLFQFNSGYGSVATAYGCRAWVNFNGTGTVAIRASGNVSSITDNGTGDYTVNFTTAMVDANYCPQLSSTYGTAASFTESARQFVNGTLTTTSVRMRVGYSYTPPAAADSDMVSVAIFR